MFKKFWSERPSTLIGTLIGLIYGIVYLSFGIEKMFIFAMVTIFCFVIGFMIDRGSDFQFIFQNQMVMMVMMAVLMGVVFLIFGFWKMVGFAFVTGIMYFIFSLMNREESFSIGVQVYMNRFFRVIGRLWGYLTQNRKMF